MKTTLEVVAALIWQNGKFLVCQRPKNKARALQWEFVGGKVEKGETKQQALKRECREELDLPVDVGQVFFHVVHEYDDVFVDLTLFHATPHGQPKMLEHADMKWITPSQIDSLDFCPADTEILQEIKRKYAAADTPS